MKKVFITGAKGTIGTVLQKQLTEHTITAADLPEFDARDIHKFQERLQGHNALIHLAWNTTKDNWLSGTMDPDNLLMAFNAYEAASRTGVRRVIMASSIHAHDFERHKSQSLISPYDPATPNSPYGAGKLYMEALGRYYAVKGLEIVCVRFMGLSPQDHPLALGEPAGLWCSHKDCGGLMKAILAAEKVSGNYAIVHAVSNNETRVHDWENPFGWKPEDSAGAKIQKEKL